MPLFDEHKEAMRSQIGDLKNAGGRGGGASTAAGFLAAFVGKTPWVHRDIAGTGWSTTSSPTSSPTTSYQPPYSRLLLHETLPLQPSLKLLLRDELRRRRHGGLRARQSHHSEKPRCPILIFGEVRNFGC